MKRKLIETDDTDECLTRDAATTKKTRREEDETAGHHFHLSEDLLFEVLKHLDARSLATAACVSKQWHEMASDERLWEMIFKGHSANPGCTNQQLRSVILALGGFRRLHSLYLWPLLKPSLSSSSSSSSSSSLSSFSSSLIGSKTEKHWGKDEVDLSISLLSIGYYEKMNPNRGSR